MHSSDVARNNVSQVWIEYVKDALPLLQDRVYPIGTFDLLELTRVPTSVDQSKGVTSRWGYSAQSVR